MVPRSLMRWVISSRSWVSSSKDGSLADQREDVGAQSAHYGFCMAFGPAAGHISVPLQGRRFPKSSAGPLGYDLAFFFFHCSLEVVEQQRLGSCLAYVVRRKG